MFEVKEYRGTLCSWYIGRGTSDYMHRDGEIVHGSVEYWPTEGQAQAVLDKFQPEHVWKHGDVFKRASTGSRLIYLIDDGKPVIYCLCFRRHVKASVVCLTDATFLFNIKDKL